MPSLRIHPLTDEVSNEQRAEWAQNALDTFTREVLAGRSAEAAMDDEDGAPISDLIADLLHLAMKRGFDPQLVINCAIGHFCEEVLMEQDSEAQASSSASQPPIPFTAH